MAERDEGPFGAGKKITRPNASRKLSNLGLAACSSRRSSHARIPFVHNPYSFGDPISPPSSSSGSPLGPLVPIGLDFPSERRSSALSTSDPSSSFFPTSGSFNSSPLHLGATNSPMARSLEPSATAASPSSPWPPGLHHIIRQVKPAAIIPASQLSSPPQFRTPSNFPVSPALRLGSSPFPPPYSDMESNLRYVQPITDDLHRPPILLMRRKASDQSNTSSTSPTSSPPTALASNKASLPTVLFPATEVAKAASADQLSASTPDLITNEETKCPNEASAEETSKTSGNRLLRSLSAPPSLLASHDSPTHQTPPQSPVLSLWKPSPYQEKSVALARFKNGLLPCTHPKPWRRIRATRGSTSFACFCCDARLRVSNATLRSTVKDGEGTP